jgi:hypothetical protein
MDKKWHYRCFDRILLKGLLQPFQQPERVVGFFNTYRSPRMAELKREATSGPPLKPAPSQAWRLVPVSGMAIECLSLWCL